MCSQCTRSEYEKRSLRKVNRYFMQFQNVDSIIYRRNGHFNKSFSFAAEICRNAKITQMVKILSIKLSPKRSVCNAEYDFAVYTSGSCHLHHDEYM